MKITYSAILFLMMSLACHMREKKKEAQETEGDVPKKSEHN